mgnify:CR=1 FL=1
MAILKDYMRNLTHISFLDILCQDVINCTITFYVILPVNNITTFK